MIQAGVVGNEIEQQAQTTSTKTLAQAGERRIAAQIGMHRVAGDRETGAGDVFLSQVRQGFVKFPAPLGVGAGHSLPCQTGLPDAQEPDPVESLLGQAIQRRIGNVVQGRGTAQRPG